MATTFKWTANASLGTVLTTELNALANGAFSAAGTVLDNTTNHDRWATAVIVLASLNPTAGANLQLFDIRASDAATYEDAPSATNPGSHMLLPGGTVSLATGAAAKRAEVREFGLGAAKQKFNLKNQAGVALGATLNTVTIYSQNEQGV